MESSVLELSLVANICHQYAMYILPNYRGTWKVGYYVKMHCPKPPLYIKPCRELIPRLCVVALGLTAIPGLKLSKVCVCRRQFRSRLFREGKHWNIVVH